MRAKGIAVAKYFAVMHMRTNLMTVLMRPAFVSNFSTPIAQNLQLIKKPDGPNGSNILKTGDVFGLLGV
jgi:hypothetical protein